MLVRRLALLALCAAASACRSAPPAEPVPGGDATAHTAAAHERVRADLDFGDRTDFELAERGLIAREDRVRVALPDGTVIWDTDEYRFEDGPAPDTVNPSLWRQARLNNLHGLYQVTDGVYQLRGYDLSNMTLIRSESGWIVVDPLTSEETAEAALEWAWKHLERGPIKAVVLTHSHIDHFGGVGAVAPADAVARGDIRVIAPRRFVEEATSENILAGIAMGRRASFMYGFGLPRSPRGHVGSGLGKSPSGGTFSVAPPTDVIDRTPQEMDIDGVRFVFQYTPESEAPAEFMFYLPDAKALCGAEVVTRNMHNLYTLRGAKVRDALRWSGYIHEALRLFPETEIFFASHHWPTWGQAEVVKLLEAHRDTYKYIHDQTLRLANAGLTPNEIAEEIRLPDALRRQFSTRGYYGTLRHNAKAVYQWYFGWYDGNPAHLDPLPPRDEAVRYVTAMGGASATIEKARAAFETGDYRWAATLLDHVVFAHPDDVNARSLLARVYDQLGYQAESGPWRDVYLTAAMELRGGTAGAALDIKRAGNLLRRMPLERFFDSMAARIDGPRAAETDMVFNFVFVDANESFVIEIANGVLNHTAAPPRSGANATIRLTRDLWVRLVTGAAGLRDLLFSDELDIDGSRIDLLSLFGLMDNPAADFPIVTP